MRRFRQFVYNFRSWEIAPKTVHNIEHSLDYLTDDYWLDMVVQPLNHSFVLFGWKVLSNNILQLFRCLITWKWCKENWPTSTRYWLNFRPMSSMAISRHFDKIFNFLEKIYDGNFMVVNAKIFKKKYFRLVTLRPAIYKVLSTCGSVLAKRTREVSSSWRAVGQQPQMPRTRWAIWRKQNSGTSFWRSHRGVFTRWLRGSSI